MHQVRAHSVPDSQSAMHFARGLCTAFGNNMISRESILGLSAIALPLLTLIPPGPISRVANSRYIYIVVGAFCALTLSVVFLHLTGFADRDAAIVATAPLVQSMWIAIAHIVFFRCLKRPPVDVRLNFASGLFWDRVLAFVTIGALVPGYVLLTLALHG